MSQENVEAAYRIIDAFNRRDLDAFLEAMDPDIEFTPYERALEGLGPYRGHAGVRDWWRESFEVIPGLRAEIFEIRDFGDQMLMHGALRGAGAASGAPIERVMWLAIRWRDQKEIWWHSFESESEALKAVGLEE